MDSCCSIPGVFDAGRFCNAWRILTSQKYAGLYGALFCRWYHRCSCVLDSWFFLAGGSYDVQTIMLWLFQMVFCTKAVTIIAGSVAERMKFAPYLIYSFIVCGIIYPIYGHWMWGGGW